MQVVFDSGMELSLTNPLLGWCYCHW